MSSQTTSPPPCPAGLDINTLFQSVPHWHQRWEIFQGIFTPGRNSVEKLLGNSGVPVERVLDVGTGGHAGLSISLLCRFV